MDVAMQDAQRNLSSLLDAAKQGEDVVIIRDGQPVARLVPFVSLSGSDVDEAIVGTLSPAARRIWDRRGRMKLDGETIHDLIADGRR